mgnify:FL=1
MKIRGSLTISRNVILKNPGDTLPKEGFFAVTSDSGALQWRSLAIIPIDNSYTYPVKYSLVGYQDSIYYY